MTFSILARDEATGECGGAVATGNLAAGAWVLRAEAGIGAIATQGLAVSVLWGEQAMRALADGATAEQTTNRIVNADAGAAARQLAILDAAGCTAAWTGKRNHDCKGHLAADNLVVAGNWLAGEGVLPALKHAFLSAQGGMAHRLLEALQAAADAGGDARGMLSAAIRVVAEDAPPLDLRVDYAKRPIADLKALYHLTLEDGYRSFLEHLPTVSQPQRCPR